MQILKKNRINRKDACQAGFGGHAGLGPLLGKRCAHLCGGSRLLAGGFISHPSSGSIPGGVSSNMSPSLALIPLLAPHTPDRRCPF